LRDRKGERVKISAVIIAGNEEAKIRGAIDSVSFADEILVVDSESTDKTATIAAELGARVVIQPWLGFSKQKQFGVDAAEHDWILSLDADERVTPALRSEIEALRSSSSSDFVAFSIPRLSFYHGRPVNHCGWYPDRQTRFFDRRHAAWNQRPIHESVEVQGPLGLLHGDLQHFSVDSASHHHRMIGERYAPMAAIAAFHSGARGSLARIAVTPAVTFLRDYLLKGGIADGLVGFIICWFAAHHAFLKNVILWELSNGLVLPEDLQSQPTRTKPQS